MRFQRFKKGVDKMNAVKRKVMRDVMYKAGKAMYQDFIDRSAVDTTDYLRGWKIKEINTGKSIGFTIKNTEKNEAKTNVLIHGAEPGKAPWYFPHRVRTGKKKGQMRKGTGKLFLHDGKVWAGGLIPGKSKAAGGVTAGLYSDKGFNKRINQEILDDYAKKVFK